MFEWTHPTGAFQLNLPEAWVVTTDDDGVAMYALDPDEVAGFHANIVVTVEEVPVGTEIQSWFGSQVPALGQSLENFRLIDIDTSEVSGLPALKIVGHHFVGLSGVAMTQWSLLAGSLGWFVTCSCAALTLHQYSELFEAMASSVQLLPSEVLP